VDGLLTTFVHLLYDTETLLANSRHSSATSALAEFLRDFRIKRIWPLFERCKRLHKSRYTISLVGLTNVGKSTLAHALLENPVAPRRNSPATSMPVEYEYSPHWCVTVHSNVSQSVIKHTASTPTEVSTSLSRYVFDDKAAADGRISRIIVTGPMSLLDSGVVFADTPGFGSARPGAADNQDNNALVKYIGENVDEVIFCIAGDSFSLLPEEHSFFESIRPLCSTIVVTKALSDDADDIEAALLRYKNTFQHLFPMCDFLFVEAKWAISSGGKSGPDKYDASRVAEVRDFIRERGAPDRRRAALRSHAVRAWADLRELSAPIIRDAGLRSIPWRSDSWAAFKRCCDLELNGCVELT
jgi:hypothetical protein